MRKYIVALSLILLSFSILAHEPKDYIDLAKKAYKNKKYSKCLKDYQTAIKNKLAKAGDIYGAACCAALIKKNEIAIQLLKQSANQGFAAIDHIKSDQDLHALHEHKDWQAILDAVGKTNEKNKTFWDGAALQVPYKDKLTVDERIAGLSKVWMEVKYNFANFDLVPELNWDAAYFEMLPKVRASANTLEYYQLLRGLFSRLKDGHTQVVLPEALYDIAYSRVPMFVELVDGQLIVTQLSAGVASKGIGIGDQLLMINGRDALDYAEHVVKPFVAASTPQDLARRVYMYELFLGGLSEPVEVRMKNAQGEEYETSIDRVSRDEFRVLMRDETIEFSVLDGNVGWLRLNSFSRDDFYKSFEVLKSKIFAVDALIVDIRKNGGGNSVQGFSVLKYLTEKSVIGSKWSTRNYKAAYRAWGYAQSDHEGETMKYTDPVDTFYSKPVAVLISASTYSAAEDFAVAFDVMDRGPLIGQATGGSTGQPLVITLPGGGKAYICTKRDRYPDGTEFIGVGVQPDIEVKPSIASIRAGKDVVLQRAIDWVNQQNK